MQLVGDELSRLALLNNHDSVRFDLLGRSAFNRYYYAAYLITRETLTAMDRTWKRANHSDIPTILETALRKPVKRQIQNQLKSGLLNKSDESRILTQLNSNSNELAQLLKNAYFIRTIADYEPEVKATRNNNIIMLNSYKLTTAKGWPSRAEMLCASIIKLWKEVGLA